MITFKGQIKTMYNEISIDMISHLNQESGVEFIITAGEITGVILVTKRI